jgi:hypothetical protein
MVNPGTKEILVIPDVTIHSPPYGSTYDEYVAMGMAAGRCRNERSGIGIVLCDTTNGPGSVLTVFQSLIDPDRFFGRDHDRV